MRTSLITNPGEEPAKWAYMWIDDNGLHIEPIENHSVDITEMVSSPNPAETQGECGE